MKPMTKPMTKHLDYRMRLKTYLLAAYECANEGHAHQLAMAYSEEEIERAFRLDSNIDFVGDKIARLAGLKEREGFDVNARRW